MLRATVFTLVCAAGLSAQHRVPAEFLYHRVYAVVPMVGTGQPGDFKRPMFAPLAKDLNVNHSGILGWQMQLSDDGKFALVEFVGRTPADLRFIVQSAAPGLQAVFERGKATPAQIEAAFQQYKKTFTLKSFGMRVQ